MRKSTLYILVKSSKKIEINEIRTTITIRFSWGWTCLKNCWEGGGLPACLPIGVQGGIGGIPPQSKNFSGLRQPKRVQHTTPPPQLRPVHTYVPAKGQSFGGSAHPKQPLRSIWGGIGVQGGGG